MSKQYTCLGMMSGTSGDGVDASIISSDGQNYFKVLKEKYYEYDNNLFVNFHDLKKKVNTFEDLKLHSNTINKLEKDITIFHAKIVKEITSNLNIDLIGFHGQTLYHSPKEKISLQLGNGNLLAQLSKQKIIYNFRKKDILNGGEGAPLTPIFHMYLLKSKKINLPAGILNIGGISNLTLIDDFNNNNISSKDVGPGCCLIDNWIQTHTNKKYDFNGQISQRGIIHELILEQALESYENNFQDKENFSFDTNDFDLSFVRGLSLEDGAATLSAYTAKIISSNIERLSKEFNKRAINIIVSGGGRNNLNLMNNIKSFLPKNINISNSDTHKLNGDFLESQAFAYLAIRSILSLPVSFPKTTGCNSPCTAGELISLD